MLYLWIITGTDGRGVYLPELPNWSDRIDLNASGKLSTHPVWMSVQAENGSWTVTPPEGYFWENGTSGAAPLVDEGYLRLKRGQRMVELMVSNCSRSNTVMRKYAWNGREITIGKDASTVINYNRRVVSRIHGMLVGGRGSIQYKDCSTNGSWINGSRATPNAPVQLAPGSRIFIPPAMTVVVFRDFFAVTESAGAAFSRDLPPFAVQNRPCDPHKDPRVTREYHRAPRQIQHADAEQIAIDPPLEKNRDRKTPTWLAVGPSTTMVLPMLVSTIAMGRTAASLVMIGCSSALAVTWAMLNRRYSEKEAVVVEENRQKICKQYYAEIEEKLIAATERERKRLNINHLSVQECLALPSGESHRMWEKATSHEDFLQLRLGNGECRLPSEITVPKPKIEMTDDDLRNEPQRLKDRYQMMQNAPIIIDARRHRIIGVLSNRR